MGPLRLQSRILDAFAVSAVAARLGLGCEEEVCQWGAEGKRDGLVRGCPPGTAF